MLEDIALELGLKRDTPNLTCLTYLCVIIAWQPPTTT